MTSGGLRRRPARGLEGVADDPTQRRTVSLLRRGYRKLTSYECSTLGYEWFGNDPGHEALSAFGLMQFSEMAKIIDVDPEMLARTRQWLLSRRDGKGGFQRNPRHLHAWSVQQDLINAYLLWAISQSDMATGELDRMERELSPELEAMQSIANDSTDPYLMALSAITLGNVGRKDAMQSLLDRLAATQQSDGHFDGSTTITQSGGISREVETTSLGILAFCQSETHPSIAQSATAWLIDHRQGGGFGSTQATVLALKALIAMHNQITAGNGGSVDVMLGDEVVQTIGWNGSPAEGVTWDLNARLIEEITSNPNASLTLRTRDQATIPYSIVYRGQTTSPQSDPDCPIALKLSFNDKTRQATIRSGDTVEVIAEIANTTDVGHPMTVAVVGLPGGLEPVIESLDKLRDTGSVDYYELRGREVILYWRSFAPDQVLRVPITCVAAVGGKYTGPPSRAYLYYTAESKTWHKPLVAEIN